MKKDTRFSKINQPPASKRGGGRKQGIKIGSVYVNKFIEGKCFGFGINTTEYTPLTTEQLLIVTQKLLSMPVSTINDLINDTDCPLNLYVILTELVNSKQKGKYLLELQNQLKQYEIASEKHEGIRIRFTSDETCECCGDCNDCKCENCKYLKTENKIELTEEIVEKNKKYKEHNK